MPPEDGELAQHGPLSLEELQAAALAGSWDIVDRALAAHADDPVAINWAAAALGEHNESLRDLAASILERSKQDLDEATADKLAKLMDIDEGEYVRFRSACALFAHGHRGSHVVAVLRGFLRDEDDEVVKIAQNYLSQVKE